MFFTQVVGLSAAQVGLGLTIATLLVFVCAVPLGKLADVVGTRRTWILASVGEAILFAGWILVGSFTAYVAITVALELATTWMRAGRNAYRLDVFPPDDRVRSQAYVRAARNVGYTLGALAAGIALAFNSRHVIQAVPVGTAAVLLINLGWLVRMPRLCTASTPSRRWKRPWSTPASAAARCATAPS